jgi:hypothetical protein
LVLLCGILINSITDSHSRDSILIHKYTTMSPLLTITIYVFIASYGIAIL